jgi:hypothetical protein
MGAVAVAVLVIVVVLVVAVAAWLLLPWRVGWRWRGHDASGGDVKPICAGVSTERCSSSYDALVRLDGVMSGCADEYVARFGGAKPRYTLKEHSSRTYAYMKRSIHVVVRRHDGTLFDDNTLAYVGLHELGHLLCGSDACRHHGPHFVLVFTRLLGIAKEKGHYDPELALDGEYPSD